MVDHLEIEIPANGVPRPIDIAMKYRRDEDCFAYNDDNSQAVEDGRLEKHRLKGASFKVAVTVRDEEGRTVSRAFVLTNPGAGAVLVSSWWRGGGGASAVADRAEP